MYTYRVNQLLVFLFQLWVIIWTLGANSIPKISMLLVVLHPNGRPFLLTPSNPAYNKFWAPPILKWNGEDQQKRLLGKSKISTLLAVAHPNGLPFSSIPLNPAYNKFWAPSILKWHGEDQVKRLFGECTAVKPTLKII